MSDKAPTGLIQSDHFLEHDTGPGHPECPERLRAIHAKLGASGLRDELDVLTAPAADLASLTRVHPASYVERVLERVEAGANFVDSPDANVSSGSYESAARAALS